MKNSILGLNQKKVSITILFETLELVTATGLEPRTTWFLNEHSTISVGKKSHLQKPFCSGNKLPRKCISGLKQKYSHNLWVLISGYFLSIIEKVKINIEFNTFKSVLGPNFALNRKVLLNVHRKYLKYTKMFHLSWKFVWHYWLATVSFSPVNFGKSRQ